MMVSFKTGLFYTQVMYIFNGRKQMLVNMIGILSALRMRGLHDKRHLLAKLHICGSKNYKVLYCTFNITFICSNDFQMEWEAYSL